MSVVFSDAFHLFALYTALNALILLVLAARVSRARAKTGIGIGDGGNPQLGRPLRAHGNNAEYTPVALLLMWAMIPLGGPLWMIHAVGATFTIGRVLHAAGLSRNEGPSPPRMAGMILTLLAYVIGIAGLLWLAVVPAAVAS